MIRPTAQPTRPAGPSAPRRAHPLDAVERRPLSWHSRTAGRSFTPNADIALAKAAGVLVAYAFFTVTCAPGAAAQQWVELGQQVPDIASLEGGRAGAPAARPETFLTAVARLGWERWHHNPPPGADLQGPVLRTRDGTTLRLRACVLGMGNDPEVLAFRAAELRRGPTLEVERAERTGGVCGAGDVTFFFRPLDLRGSDPHPALIVAVPPGGLPSEQVLAPNASTPLSLPSRPYVIYAFTAGDPIAIRVGAIVPAPSMRPLIRALRTEQGAMRVLWDAPLGVALALDWADALVDELALAADVERAWLQDGRGQRHPVLVDTRAHTLRLPASLVRLEREEALGRGAHGTSPTEREWMSIFATVQLCAEARYRDAEMGSGESVCASLGTLVARGGAPEPRVEWLLSPRHLTARGARSAPGVAMRLECGAEAPCETPMFATVGDELRVESRDRTFVCTRQECLPTPPAGHMRFAQSGLHELRVAHDIEAARSEEALTLHRWIVVDPARDWHPAGFRRVVEGARGGPWAGVAWDEHDVASMTRSEAGLRTVLAFAAADAALVGAARADARRASVDVAVLGPVTGYGDTRAVGPLVSFVSEEPSCPREHSARARLRLLPPERALRDRVMHLFLAEHRAEHEPFRCLARVTLRVRDERTLPSTWPLRLAWLEDLYVGLAIVPPAVVATFQLLAAHLHLGEGFVISAGAGVGARIPFDGADVSAGLCVQAVLLWGVPQAPRIVGAGVVWSPLGTQGTAIDSLWPVVLLDITSVLDAVGGA